MIVLFYVVIIGDSVQNKLVPVWLNALSEFATLAAYIHLIFLENKQRQICRTAQLKSYALNIWRTSCQSYELIVEKYRFFLKKFVFHLE